MTGYDFDGVVYRGPGLKPDDGDVIITGRMLNRALETLGQMEELGVQCQVFFCPYGADPIKDAARHKAEIINALGIKTFYENEPEQIEVIRSLCPNVEVILVA